MSNVFQIKKGDLLPAMVVDLVDAGGSPIDVTDGSITVKVHMVAESGEVLIDREAAKDGSVVNRVRLVWQDGETDLIGSYSVDWSLEVAGKSQSFPTATFNRVEVVPSYEDLSDYSEADVNRIRGLTGEAEETTLSFLDIVGYMNNWVADDGSVDVYAAARDIWIMKAASYAEMVDITESGSSRSLGDLHKQALTMAKMMAETSPLIAISSASTNSMRPTRTRAIVRP